MLLVRNGTLHHSSSSVFNTSCFFLTFCFGLIFNFLYHFISCRFKVFYLSFDLRYRLLPPTILCKQRKMKHCLISTSSSWVLIHFYDDPFSFSSITSHYYPSFFFSFIPVSFVLFLNWDSCSVSTHLITGK